MPILRHSISEFLQLSQNDLLFDVRSPGEYDHAHIPGAVSLPLFTNDERKEVGTAYKQVSREHAIKLGLDAFGPKMRAMVETVERAAKSSGFDHRAPVFLYCWRGGMRSGAVAWLLDLYGFEVHVLDGGYKAFRNHVLEAFTLPRNYCILGGYTGAGKTEVLHRLKELGETIIDLEGLASHKGSAFGNIDMPAQPTQEMFENLLALELLATMEIDSLEELGSRFTDHGSRVWLEDESQRIGQLHIPHTMWALMRKAPIAFLDIPFEQRLDHLVEEYGPLDRDRLRDAIIRITKRLGGQHAKAALEHLDNGKTRDCFNILLQYYDKHYQKGVQDRENAQVTLHNFACEQVHPDNAIKLIS